MTHRLVLAAIAVTLVCSAALTACGDKDAAKPDPAASSKPAAATTAKPAASAAPAASAKKDDSGW